MFSVCSHISFFKPVVVRRASVLDLGFKNSKLVSTNQPRTHDEAYGKEDFDFNTQALPSGSTSVSIPLQAKKLEEDLPLGSQKKHQCVTQEAEC